MLALRHYQEKAIEATFHWWGAADGAPLVVLPTGTGKSVVVAELCRRSHEWDPGVRVLMLTHVQELVAQNFAELIGLWPDAPAGVYSAGLGKRQIRQITFASIQSVYAKAERFQKVDIVIVDECFVAGTMVETIDGPRPIETIAPGAVVRNATGFGRVRAVSVKRSRSLVRIKMSNGEEIVCTDQHPFFTENGWTQAGKLGRGSRLFRAEGVRALRRDFSALDEGRGEADARASMGSRAFLLDLLLQEERERDVGSWCEGENAGDPSGNWAPSSGESGERSRPYGASDSCPELAGRWLGIGASGPDRRAATEGRPTHLLQDRCGQPDDDDCHRTGRTKSCREEDEAGPSERQSSCFVRVESVSAEEQSSDTDVFNLDVSGHPSYYAGGVLVHNCHLIPHDGDGMYRKMLSDLFVMNPHIKIVGLTATPYRMDRGRLDAGDGAIFAGVCYEYGIRQAIDEGFLSPLITKATHARLDTSGVGTRGGEFIPGQLEKAVDIDELNAAIVREVVGIAEVAERKSWLFFCSGISHATHICELVREMGHTCETIHAKTPKDERKRIISEFKQGKIKALASMNVLTTGFNAPAVDLIAMLRPTQSLGLYVQMAGRGTRLFAGKSNCLVLDFARNIETHGPVDLADAEEREKGEGEAPVKECPDCEAYIHAAARVCPHCGHEFPPPEPKVTRFAADAPILSQPAASQWIDVDEWEVRMHAVPGRIPTLEVRYQCGMTRHRQWICFEHDGYARQKGIGWWRRQGGKDPVPSTIAEAVDRRSELVRPGQISVRPSGRYTEIVGTRALPSVLSGGEVVGLSPTSFSENDIPF